MKRLYFLGILLLTGWSASAQTTFTFTNATATGPTGPTQGQVNTEYTGTTLDGLVTVNTQGIQEWTVPATATYHIEAWGAQGGNTGGQGAYMSGDFNLTGGEVLHIIVGQEGLFLGFGSGGGGGSFVVTSTNTPLLIAGGGGGSGHSGAATGNPIGGQTGTDGTAGSYTSPGAGGTGGNGGESSSSYAGTYNNSGGGGGFYTDGVGDGAATNPGLAFLNGGVGGFDTGGFGGGGGGINQTWNCSAGNGGGGGGGGYSGGGGGGGSCNGGGGGAGSFNSGTNQINTAASNTGNGMVVITQLCAGLNVNASATTICDGEGVTLSATSQNGGTITWDNGVTDGVSFDPPVGTTTYTATSSDMNDCPYSIDITVNPSPSATMGALSTLCFYDNAFELTGGAPAGGVYSGNGVITNDVFDPGTAGIGVHTITYTITDPGTGCEGTASEDITVDECLGIEENEADMRIYPNPAYDVLNIVAPGEFEYTILNALGQQMISGKGDLSVTVDLSNYAFGAYFVEISTVSGTRVLKIVKQ